MKNFVKFLGAFFGVLMFAGSTSPTDFSSNISQWLNILGFSSLPEWLLNPSIDVWLRYLGLTIAVISIFSFLPLDKIISAFVRRKNINIPMENIPVDVEPKPAESHNIICTENSVTTENTQDTLLQNEQPIVEPPQFITLEEAAILFHEKHPLSDQLLAYVVPMEKRSAIDEAIEKLNGENNNNWKEHHWRTTNILHILSRFFANGLLKLYGEHYPGKKLQVVPIQDIKNWGEDFVSLFSDYDRKHVNYTNLSCELNEFLNFVYAKKECILSEGQIQRFAGV